MGIFDTVIAPIASIINRIIPDKAAAAAAIAQLNQLTLQGQLQEELVQLQSVTVNQTDVNKVEAASPSMFVAGPRPAIMWVCALALFYQYLVRPIATGLALIASHPIPAPGLPGIDDNLYQLMFALLGIGAMRSYDKTKGTETKSVSFFK
jgi:hypothetical protein